MSTAKTKIDSKEIVTFLKKKIDSNISKVDFLKGGEMSQACAFSTHKGNFVIRVNKDKHTYEKDKYAFDNFSSVDIPIPEILDIGRFNKNLFYAISTRAEGKTFDLLDKETASKLLPKLIKTLDEIHNIEIGEGKYGYWDQSGKANISSWKEFMLHKEDKFVSAYPKDDFIQRVYQSIQSCEQYFSEDRCLVHGDYGFNNLVTDGENISGVLDWGESVYGDFLYDVAWLVFWPSEIPFMDIFKEHYKKIGKKVDYYEERIRCYQLQIGLGAMAFFDMSKQKSAYDWTKNRLVEIIK